jgi:hypothetical protein
LSARRTFNKRATPNVKTINKSAARDPVDKKREILVLLALSLERVVEFNFQLATIKKTVPSAMSGD